MVARVSPITFKSKWYQDKVEGSSPLLLAFFASFLPILSKKMLWGHSRRHGGVLSGAIHRFGEADLSTSWKNSDLILLSFIRYSSENSYVMRVSETKDLNPYFLQSMEF